MKKINKKWVWILLLFIAGILLTIIFIYPNCDTLLSAHYSVIKESDKSCSINEDCEQVYDFWCGTCVNKNADLSRKELIESLIEMKMCSRNWLVKCAVDHCECKNNVCEIVIGS